MQFKAHAKEEDPVKIEAFKTDAVRALSNYMVYQSAQKDTHLQKAMNFDNPSAENKAQNKDLMTVEMEHSRGGMTVNTCKYLGSSLKSAFCNILHVRILLASVSCPGKNS